MIGELGLENRVQVHQGRAEDAARDATLRGTFDVVVARSFGPPAVTAECAAPFLVTGGRLVVSEPPGAEDSPADEPVAPRPPRWPAAGLRSLGMVVGEAWATPFHFQSLTQETPCPDEFPRRVGVPSKRPLF